jgi:hypothetical protein
MDTRTRIEKLRAMAAEDNGASEGERDNARRILANMGVGSPPPRRPTAVGASPYDDDWARRTQAAFDAGLERTRQQFRDAQQRTVRDANLRTMFERRQDANTVSYGFGSNSIHLNTAYVDFNLRGRR